MDISDHKTLIILLVILVVLVAIMYKYKSSIMSMFTSKSSSSSGSGMDNYTGYGEYEPYVYGGAKRRTLADMLGKGNNITLPSHIVTGLGTTGYGSDSECDECSTTKGGATYGYSTYSVYGNGSAEADVDERNYMSIIGDGKERNRVKLFVDEVTYKAIENGSVTSIIISAGRESFVELLNRLAKKENSNARVSCMGVADTLPVQITEVIITKSNNLKEVVENHKNLKFNAYKTTAEYLKSFRSDPLKPRDDGSKPQLVIVNIELKKK